MTSSQAGSGQDSVNKAGSRVQDHSLTVGPNAEAMQVELSRFRVKPNCSGIVEEWIAFLNDNMHEVLVTLEGERMYVESIFTECIDGVDYMYWYAVQGEGGDAVENSEHWIDKKHIEYWQACIDKAYPAADLPSRVTMIPERIRQLMR